MRKVARRELFVGAGSVAVTTALWRFTRKAAAANSVTSQKEGKSVFPWSYEKLDPDLTAEKSYKFSEHKGCMYKVFKCIVSQLEHKVGEPYKYFPFELMAYGAGGVSGWGTLCGLLNAAAAVINLFSKKARVR